MSVRPRGGAPSTTSSDRPNSRMRRERARIPRWMWILLMLLVALNIGGIGAFLAHAGGANGPSAILTGGGSFAGTVLLLLAIAHYVSADY